MANTDRLQLQMDAKQIRNLLGDLVTVVEPAEGNKLTLMVLGVVLFDHLATALGCRRDDIKVRGSNGVVRKLEISPNVVAKALANQKNKSRIAIKRLFAQQIDDKADSKAFTNIQYANGEPNGFVTYFSHVVTVKDIAARLGCNPQQVHVQENHGSSTVTVPLLAVLDLQAVAEVVQKGMDYVRDKLPVVSFGLFANNDWGGSVDLNMQAEKLSKAMDPGPPGAAHGMCIRHLVRAVQNELGYTVERVPLMPEDMTVRPVEGLQGEALKRPTTRVSLIPPSVRQGPD